MPFSYDPRCVSRQARLALVQVQIAAHHALMLQSKCKAKARSLQALHHTRCTLLHSLTQLQCDVKSQQQPARSRSSNINPYEWSLLQNGEKLRQHEASLAAAACIAADCRQAEHHAAVFFEWLSSQHQQQEPVEAAAQQVSLFQLCNVQSVHRAS